MKKPKLLLLALGVLALFGWLCTFQVNESESVIVTRFGDPHAPIDEPGLHLKWPAPLDLLIRVDRRVRLLDPEAAEFLTGDKKNIEANCLLAWRVSDPLVYVASLGDDEVAEARLKDVLIAEVGNLLGAYDMSALVSVTAEDAAAPGDSGLSAINDELTRLVAQSAGESFGVEVLLARIKRLNFPKQNKNAVFSRMGAERQKIAMQIRSEGREQAENLRSDAQLEAAMLLSEARRKAEEVRGQGDAQATRIYNQAYGADPELFEFLGSLATAEESLGEGDLFVMPDDHWLLRFLNDGQPAPPPAPEDGTQ